MKGAGGGRHRLSGADAASAACGQRARRRERRRRFQDIAAASMTGHARRACWSAHIRRISMQDDARSKLHLVSIIRDLVVAPCGRMAGKASLDADRRGILGTSLSDVGTFGSDLL